MNSKEIKELVEFLIEKDIAEFELERGDVKLRVKRGAETHIVAAPIAPIASAAPVIVPQAATVATLTPSVAAPPAASAATAQPEASPAPVDENLHIVKSPIVGTYYESPSPGSPPFIKVGDTVAAGQILCIVEAMKLMNEIESDVSGEVVKMLVSNGQPVEYGQPLFAIRPR
jgi:acetyl-CoA carboxylase biotin carboxyl carrier protein